MREIILNILDAGVIISIALFIIVAFTHPALTPIEDQQPETEPEARVEPDTFSYPDNYEEICINIEKDFIYKEHNITKWITYKIQYEGDS